MENNPKHLDMWESYSSSQMRSVKKMFKKTLLHCVYKNQSSRMQTWRCGRDDLMALLFLGVTFSPSALTQPASASLKGKLDEGQAQGLVVDCGKYCVSWLRGWALITKALDLELR